MSRRLPGTLRVVQGFLYVFAGLVVIQFDPSGLASDSTVEVVSIITWLLSGGLSLACAIWLPRGDMSLFWGIVALQVYLLALSVASMSGVWPYQPIPALLVLAVVGLLCHGSSRRYFHQRPAIF